MNWARPDVSLLLLTALQVVGTAPLLNRKRRRWKRRADSYEWDRVRCGTGFLNEVPVEWMQKSGPHIVFYADGFAETRLAVQLGRALGEQRPDWRFSVVIRNLQDAQNGHAIPANWPYSALPFEFYPAVKRWFNAVSPDGVVMIEKLWYPIFVRSCTASGAHVVGVNSYSRAADTRKRPAFKRWTLKAFTRLGLRSEQQAALLSPLIPSKVSWEVTGTLKFPAPSTRTKARSSELEAWLDLAGQRPIIAAGSIEKAEFEVLCEAFAKLREQCDAVLLWAPRQIATGESLAARLEQRGWKCARRSQPLNTPHPDILLLDTMGELASVYERCQGAFVGGTFAGAGHNVLEPLAGGVPVVFGPKRGFFAAEQQLCEDNGVGLVAENAEQLGEAWRRMLCDVCYRQDVREKLAVFIAHGQKNWDATLALLLDEFDRL